SITPKPSSSRARASAPKTRSSPDCRFNLSRHVLDTAPVPAMNSKPANSDEIHADADIISRLLWKGPPHVLLTAAREDPNILLHSGPRLLAELADVLGRRKLRA